MNIDEYRALKAQNEAQGTDVNAQTHQTSAPPVQQELQSSPQGEPVSAPQGTETASPDQTSLPQTFTINGQQVTLDELQKGYLRQADYTRKTQELSRAQRELDAYKPLVQKVQATPEVQQALGVNPMDLERNLLEQERADLQLQHEITTLSAKYADFDVNAVLDTAVQRRTNSLEDAYFINKQLQASTPPPQVTQTVDVEALKAQLRAELQAELNTSTIISSNGGSAPTTPQAPQLTPEQSKVARMMKMSDAEYAKWANF